MVLLLTGTIGYRLLCHLSWLDSFYFTVITMSTVGYREVGELDAAGKIFTIGLIFSGVGVLAYSVSSTLELLLDEQHRSYFRHLLNRRRSRRMEHHYIVCGMGRVGRSVCQELADCQIPFLVVDSQPDKISIATSLGWVAILGDASEDKILHQANIVKARGLVCTVDTDASNLFILVSAKALNPSLEVSARVNEDSNVKKFERAGAIHVYSPFSLLGRRIARTITRPRVLELLDIALESNNFDITIEEFTVSKGSPLAWLSLKDSGIRQNFGGVVMSIIRENREIVHNPDPELVCQPGDILITLGTPEQLKRMREIVELK
ncbi:potassium channel protein [bacterium]|nr:potassium channel protein [bacterium]